MMSAVNPRAFLTGRWGGEPSYGKAYLEAFPEYVRDETTHQAKVDELIERLQESGLELPMGARVLVLGAGHGTHDVALARHGLLVVSIDILYESLKIGRESAKAADASVDHVVADMTSRLPFNQSSMDAVFSLGSSFGFEDDDNCNAAVFRFSSDAMRLGGVFILDYVNGRRLCNLNHQHQSVHLLDGLLRTEEFRYDAESSSSITKITLRRANGEVVTFFHYMKYYTLAQIEQMMTMAGFSIVRVCGSAQGEPFDPEESEQMVIIATKRT